MDISQKQSFEHKEYKQIAVLLCLALFCMGGLFWTSLFYKENRVDANKQAQTKKNFLEEIAPPPSSPKIISVPFQEDALILEQTEDDSYLETKGFFYLFHKVYSSSKEENFSFERNFDWRSLMKIEDRPRLRGKKMRIRGTLVDIKRKVFQGDLAESRGLKDVFYWQGAIYDGEHIYLFAVSDFPQEYPQKDTVELIGAFYKIWMYETRSGEKNNAPFFIGKKLQFLKEVEAKGTEKLSYIFILFLGIVLLLVLFNMINDRKKNSRRITRVVFLLFSLISGCLEKEDKYEPGRILQSYLPEGKQISYISPLNQETDRILFSPEGCYRILEKTSPASEFLDTRPIHCVLVAIDRYPDVPLEYCKEDMNLFKQYLQKCFVSFQQTVKIVELYDEKATRKNLLEALEEQRKHKEKYSTAIFVFSGHGTQNSLNLFKEEISLSHLQTYFQTIDSRRVLWIIDSCHAGAFIPKEENIPRKNKYMVFSQEKLFPSSSPYSFMHCFVGNGKALLCASLPGEESKDGVFLRAILSHLASLEDSTPLQPMIQKINERIFSYNKACRPENILPMTPFLKIYGDIQIAILYR